MASSRQEAMCWEQSENDAAKCHRKALDCMIQAAEEAVEYAKTNNLLRQEVIDTKNELAKAVQAKNSQYQVQKVGWNAEAHITSLTMRPVEPTFNPMNVGDPKTDVVLVPKPGLTPRSITMPRSQPMSSYPLFQPHVPLQPSAHLHCNQVPCPAMISVNPPCSAKMLISTRRPCIISEDGNKVAMF